MSAELNAARERAHQLFRCSHDGMAYSDLDGHILEVNEAFARLTGRAPAELLATTYQAITPAEYHDLDARFVRSVVESGAPAAYEKEYVGKRGERIPVWVSLFLLTTEDGRPSCLGVIVRGLGDRRLAEQALRHIQRVESLRVLARGVSHDFNNVLGTVVGHLALARQATPAEGPAAEHLQRATAATERAAALVDQLLVYAGSGEYRPQPTDMNALLQEQRPLLESLVGDGARLVFELAAELPAIPIDRRQLQQLLANVVTNAVEAGRIDSVSVTVRTRLREMGSRERARWSRTGTLLPEGRYVVIEVVDDGCGMSAETLARVFDPFYSTKFIGRGLGLATALGVARAHHGGIDVESEPGRGTTLTVMLPCAAAPRPVTAPSGAVAPGATILLVEDEPDILAFASHVLRSSGYTVVSAVDGLQAVEIFGSDPGRFGLVFLDLSMPRMDGRETLHRLRAVRPGIRVLLTSGYSTTDATASFAPGELSGFLHKPYDGEALLEKIRQALR